MLIKNWDLVGFKSMIFCLKKIKMFKVAKDWKDSLCFYILWLLIAIVLFNNKLNIYLSKDISYNRESERMTERATGSVCEREREREREIERERERGREREG